MSVCRYPRAVSRPALAAGLVVLGWAMVSWGGNGAQGLPPAAPPVAAADAVGTPQPRLRTVALKVGDADLVAEIACSREEQARGLMHRASLADGEGMLFVFERPAWLSFWMKDTPLPLTVAYLDAQGVIRELHDLQPLSTTRIDSQGPDLQFALEVPRGWFLRHGITAGSSVATAAGPLATLRCTASGAPPPDLRRVVPAAD